MHTIREDRHFIYLFAFLSIIAYGTSSFNIIFFGDDWDSIHTANYQMDWVVTIGRWLQRFLWQLFDNNFYTPVFTISIFLISIYFSGKILSKTLALKTANSMYVFILIFAFSPVLIEPTTFKMNHTVYSLGIFFSSLSAYFISYIITQNLPLKKKIMYILLGGASLSIAASTAQGTVFITLQIIFILLIKDLITKDLSAKQIAKYIYILFSVITVGIVFYIIELSLMFSLLNLEVSSGDGDYSLTSFHRDFSALFSGLKLGWDLMIHFLFYPQHFYPLATKILFLFAIVGILVISTQSISNNSDIKRTTYIMLLIVALMFVMLFSPFIIASLLNPPRFRYNALVSIASLHGLFFALLIELTRTENIKKLCYSLIFLILAIFIFEHNKSSTIKVLLNFRDLSQANRILDRIESHPHFNALERRGSYRLVIVGKQMKHSSQGRVLNSQTKGLMGSSIVNCGVMNCQFRRLPSLFKLLGASKHIKMAFFYYALPKDINHKLFHGLINNKQPWPAQESLIPIKDGFALIIDDSQLK